MSKVEFKVGEKVEVSYYEDFSSVSSATFLANTEDVRSLHWASSSTLNYPIVVINNVGSVEQFRYVRKPAVIKYTVNAIGSFYETTEELYNEYLDVIKRIKEST